MIRAIGASITVLSAPLLGSGQHENSGKGWSSWQLDLLFCRLRPRRKWDHAVSCSNINFPRTQSSDVNELARRLEDVLPQPIASDASSHTASPSLISLSENTAASRSPASNQDTPHTVDSQVVTPPCYVAISLGPLYSAAKHLGPHWFFNGVPIFSDEGQRWVSSQTGQQVKWSEFRIPMYRPTPLSVLHPDESDSGLLDLIDQSTVRLILGPLFITNAPLVFPVIDPVLFETTLDTAYEILDDRLSSPTHIAARACVLAALSILGRMKIPGASPSPLDPERSAIEAQRLLSLNPGFMSHDTLTTVLVLVRWPSNKSPWSVITLTASSKANAMQLERKLARRLFLPFHRLSYSLCLGIPYMSPPESRYYHDLLGSTAKLPRPHAFLALLYVG